MAGTPDKPRRPVVGSRNPTGRPRKIPSTVVEPTSPAVEPTSPVVEPTSPVVEPTSPVVEPTSPVVEPVETPAARRTGRRGGPGTTVVLLAVILVLALVSVGEVIYLTRDATATVSAARPVVTGELTHRAAVEAAARSTEEILSTSFENYDEQVDQAMAKMTDAFAEQYRETSSGIRDQFLAQKTRLQVKAVAQGVVQASPAQVQALLFLDQYVEKTEDGQPRTDFRQYRALVTVVHTDQGWLVSNIETQ